MRVDEAGNARARSCATAMATCRSPGWCRPDRRAPMAGVTAIAVAVALVPDWRGRVGPECRRTTRRASGPTWTRATSSDRCRSGSGERRARGQRLGVRRRGGPHRSSGRGDRHRALVVVGRSGLGSEAALRSSRHGRGRCGHGSDVRGRGHECRWPAAGLRVQRRRTGPAVLRRRTKRIRDSSGPTARCSPFRIRSPAPRCRRGSRMTDGAGRPAALRTCRWRVSGRVPWR